MVTEMDDDDDDVDLDLDTATVLVVQESIHLAEYSPGSRNSVSNVSDVVTIVAEYRAASSRAFASFRSNRTVGAESIVGGGILRLLTPSSL